MSKGQFIKKALSLFICVALVFNLFLSPGITLNPLAYAQPIQSPTAQDIYEEMRKLNDPDIPPIEKERITAVIFVHQDVYRRGVVDGIVPRDDAIVQVFLKNKNQLQLDVARRMNTNYRNRTGSNLREPIVPFPSKTAFSDDDIIVGTGGKASEALYAESLDEVIRSRAGRPMSAADRARLDVNGLAWNMTVEGGIDNFWNKEKYLNPQSGVANRRKLMDGDLQVVDFDPVSGEMRVHKGPEAERIFNKHFDVEDLLEIPDIPKGVGSGPMSDYLRSASIHKVDFSKPLTKEDIIQFMRNQKYSERLIKDFEAVALDENPELASRYKQFAEVSEAIGKEATALGLARVLEKAYGIKIINNIGGKDVANFENLAKAMNMHQNMQLSKVMPDLLAAVSKNEAYKIVGWLKNQPLGSQARKKLRKQLALTYAALDEKQVNSILSDIDKLDVDEANKAWLVKAIDEDSKMIRQYAEVVGMPKGEFARSLSLDGPSPKVVDWLEHANEKVSVFARALDAQPGGKRFKEFLRSKTAKALNLDVIFEGTRNEKIMHWSILLLATARAYSAAGEQESKWKAMGMALFEMIPFVSATLRFSELEYKEAFKQLAMDVFPPLILADIAVAALHYTAASIRDSFTEAVWDGLTREAMRDFSDSDFEKTDTGYWRLKDRQSYLNFLEEVEPGFGRVAKLAPMVSAQVDALMDRNPQVQTNNAALYTLQWFERFDYKALSKLYAGQFNLEELRRRVWEKGLLAQGEAKNVERVAASIILDNLCIRADIYKQVLDGFIDRIERRYNLLKGQSDKECQGGMVRSMLGLGNDLCGASSIISNAQLILKQLYEEARIKMKDSDWGIPKLDEGYRQRLDAMMKYNIAGRTELGVRQDMQAIIDDFRKFIRLLFIAVELEKELRVLQLNGYVYGGAESFEATQEVMLGDEFRIGASARIQPKRAGLKWTLYYYLEGQSGDIKLLDKVSLNPQEFNPGAEGLWVIKHPEKKTFLQIKRVRLEPDFENEGTYNIYPVIAYGNWGKDPVSQLGLYVLQNPLDAPELFKENMVAFAGGPVTFSLVRPKIKASLASFMYKNETNLLKLYLEAPKYLKEDNFQAEFQTQSGALELQFNPQALDKISLNKEKPSSTSISVPKDAKEGAYIVKVKVTAKSIAEKFQPLAQFKEFQYIDTPNLDAPQTVNFGQDFAGQASGLEKRAQELVDKAKEIKQALADQIKEFSEKYSQSIRELANIDKMSKGFKLLAQDAESKIEKLKRIVLDADNDGKKASSIRNSVEKYVLACCEAVKSVMNAKGEPSVFNPLLETAYSEYSKARKAAEDFNDRCTKIKSSLESAKGLADAVKKSKDKQDELKAAIKSVAEGLDTLEAGLDSFRSQASDIAGLKADMAGIVQEAAGILEQAKLSAQDARVLKQVERIVHNIKEKDNSVTSYSKSAESMLKSPEEKFNVLKKKYDNLQGTAITEIKNLLEKDLFKEAEENLKDIQAAYDTILIYKDAVDEFSTSANQCISGINNNTQGIVSRTDCSAYSGTRAQWDRQKNTVVCFCDPGYVWDKKQNKCITNKEYELAYYNCDKYPNAQLYWDEAAGQSKCRCNSGYEWNNAGTACRVESSTQVARANCSGYPGTSPVWDNSSETVQCYCPPGQNWDSLSNSCITPYQPPPQDYSAPQQTQENPPNLFEDLPYVEKPVTTQEPPPVQDQGYTGGGIDNQPDSEGYYTSGTGKGAYYDKLRQQGLMKDPQGATITGLSDVTVNKNQVTLSVWDNSREDLDRVGIYLNGEVVVSNLIIRNQPQNFTLYLRPGSNTLTVKALNIGDPEINKRFNMSPYNSAAVSISGVSVGKSSQSWNLSEGQSASMTIDYRQ